LKNVNNWGWGTPLITVEMVCAEENKILPVWQKAGQSDRTIFRLCGKNGFFGIFTDFVKENTLAHDLLYHKT
jgi:hypothetical protein